MPGETLVVVAYYLRSDQAGLLAGLLRSAGIDAVVTDDALADPALRFMVGGAKVSVRALDEERAREIARAAGILDGGAPPEPVDIPEEEWSAAAPRERDRGARALAAAARGQRTLAIALALLALVLAAYWLGASR